jgi:hypothetical protein
LVPKIYHAFLEAELLSLEQEEESLREFQAERNMWVLRHLCCGSIALFLLWMVKTSTEMAVSSPMEAAITIYAASSLVFAVLESLVAQKIAGFLAAVPVRAKLPNQG